MSEYNTTKNGSFEIDGMIIPDNESNRHYRQMQEEVAVGDSTILPYIQPLEELRQEKIQAIKSEGLRRMGLLVEALSNFDTAVLIFGHLWGVLSDTSDQDMISARLVYDHARSRVNTVKSATREQLEAYDPSTDNGWP